MSNWTEKRMITVEEAEDEAYLRFPNSTSRARDFVRSYLGLVRKGKFGREKYRFEYGQGRRERLTTKPARPIMFLGAR